MSEEDSVTAVNDAYPMGGTGWTVSNSASSHPKKPIPPPLPDRDSPPIHSKWLKRNAPPLPLRPPPPPPLPRRDVKLVDASWGEVTFLAESCEGKGAFSPDAEPERFLRKPLQEQGGDNVCLTGNALGMNVVWKSGAWKGEMDKKMDLSFESAKTRCMKYEDCVFVICHSVSGQFNEVDQKRCRACKKLSLYPETALKAFPGKSDNQDLATFSDAYTNSGTNSGREFVWRKQFKCPPACPGCKAPLPIQNADSEGLPKPGSIDVRAIAKIHAEVNSGPKKGWYRVEWKPKIEGGETEQSYETNAVIYEDDSGTGRYTNGALKMDVFNAMGAAKRIEEERKDPNWEARKAAGARERQVGEMRDARHQAGDHAHDGLSKIETPEEKKAEQRKHMHEMNAKEDVKRGEIMGSRKARDERDSKWADRSLKKYSKHASERDEKETTMRKQEREKFERTQRRAHKAQYSETVENEKHNKRHAKPFKNAVDGLTEYGIRQGHVKRPATAVDAAYDEVRKAAGRYGLPN